MSRPSLSFFMEVILKGKPSTFIQFCIQRIVVWKLSVVTISLENIARPLQF